MTGAISLRRDAAVVAGGVGQQAVGHAVAEFTVTVRVSTAPGQDADVPVRFAEQLRAVLEQSSTPVTRMRHEPAARPSPSLCIDASARTVRRDGVELGLTRLEFDLLLYLASNPGRVFTRPMLLAEVWQTVEPARMRTVDVHITRLRNRLGPDFRLIVTVRGFGYRLNDAAGLTVLK